MEYHHYYTQLQQQIMGLDAPFGYLTVLFETSWKVYTFFVHRDDAVINDIYINDTKVWQRILDRKAGIVSPEIKTRSQILHEDYERTSLRWDNKHKDEKKKKRIAIIVNMKIRTIRTTLACNCKFANESKPKIKWETKNVKKRI